MKVIQVNNVLYVDQAFQRKANLTKVFLRLSLAFYKKAGTNIVC